MLLVYFVIGGAIVSANMKCAAMARLLHLISWRRRIASCLNFCRSCDIFLDKVALPFLRPVIVGGAIEHHPGDGQDDAAISWGTRLKRGQHQGELP